MIPYTRPAIGSAEMSYVMDAVGTGWGVNCNSYLDRFEMEFATKLGSEFSIATSSCTGALVLSLRALGVANGDEVIISDASWVAAASAVMTVGALPIMVDIESETWCISPDKVEKAITGKTRAIIVTHLYGNIADLGLLVQIGKAYGIPIIEDAAESLGSRHKGKYTGTFADIGVFSFHATKLLTTGEGGMIVTDREDLANKIRTLNNHGRKLGESKQFWSDEQGYKFKMSNIQAALGLGQLERLDLKVERKREIFFSYQAKLRPAQSAIQLNFEAPGDINSFWMPTVCFSLSLGVSRDKILQAFRNEGIDARVFFWPLSSFPFLGGKALNPVAEDISSRSINLPSFEEMSDEDIRRVSQIVLNLCGA
jgi:perosamine synthetase